MIESKPHYKSSYYASQLTKWIAYFNLWLWTNLISSFEGKDNYELLYIPNAKHYDFL